MNLKAVLCHSIRAAVALAAVTSLSVTAGQAQISGAVGLLKGDVVSKDGQHVAGISIAIYKGTERITTTKSTVDGKFQAVLKPNATYRIAYTSNDYGYHEDTLSVPALEKYQEFPLHATLIAIREGQSFGLNNPVFMPKSSSIDASVTPQLEEIVTLMRHNPKLSVNITVFPDAQIKSKKDAAQQKLADARATAVRSFFLGKNIPASNVTVVTSTNVPEGRFASHQPQVEDPKKGKKAPAAKLGLIPQYVEIVAHLAS